jgi:hypothetical protein
MRKLLLGAVGAALLVALLLTGTSYKGADIAHAVAGTVNYDVDPETTGNTASTLGTVEECVRVDIASPVFDGVDDDSDGAINDGCPVMGTAEPTTPVNKCLDAIDDDNDGRVNDGCPTVGAAAETACDTGSDYNIDIVVTGDTQAPDYYDVNLNYDSTKVHVAAPGTDTYIKMPGGFCLNDALPDSDGSFAAGCSYLAGGPGTPNDGTITRVGLDIGSSGLVTFTFNDYPLTDYHSAGGDHPVVLGSGQLAINTACPGTADVEIVSQVVKASDCSSDPPATINAGTPTILCLRKSIRNNGPDTPVDGSITTTLVQTGGGNDCAITPVGGNPTTFTVLTSTPQTKDEKFTINCTNHCTHSFNFTNTLAVTPPKTDPIPANNTNIQTAFSTNVIREADLDVTSVTVDAPASAAVSTAFDVTVTANVTNNGPGGPATANVTLDLDMLLTGCTKDPTGTQVDALTGLGADSASAEWSVTCTTIGSKTFDGSGSAALTTLHLTDSTSGNNSDTGSDSTNILASADAQIVSWVFPDEMPAVGNQVRVVPGVAENMDATETLDNNGGTYAGDTIDVGISVTRTAGANCAATPSPLTDTATLPMIGTDVTDTHTWSVTLSSPATSCTITFDKTITITTSGVIDSHLADNTASRSVILVADTDGDTVPNNYGGTIDNCPDDSNPGQLDTDLDGVGDVCDNCPGDSNPGQLDTDTDGLGDVCDNCPDDANPGQEDVETDGVGNVCDNCRNAGNLGQEDGDLDCPAPPYAADPTCGDACDICPDDALNDTDADDICVGVRFNSPKTGGNDNCPYTVNSSQLDSDTPDDGVGDACEGDVNCSGGPFGPYPPGNLEAVDALFILQNIVRLRTASSLCPPPTGALYLPAADVNGDSLVDVIDALFVLQCVAGFHNVWLCPPPE